MWNAEYKKNFTSHSIQMLFKSCNELLMTNGNILCSEIMNGLTLSCIGTR